jgi:hypothetical protein
MLDVIARLLVALAVAMGAQGVGTAGDHGSPGGNADALAAIEAIIARVSDAVAATNVTVTTGQPDTTGLDKANEVANDHAADGLAKAADAKAAGQAKADAARAAHQPASAPTVDTPPVPAPPVDTPPTKGPPATTPPVPAPPVPTPPRP